MVMSGVSGTYAIIRSVTSASATQSELRRISRRAAAVSPSATLAVDAKAKALQAAGEHVIGFGAGEPDFATPAHIVDAAARAMTEGQTRYTPPEGIAPLRMAIRRHLAAAGLVYRPREVMAACGATGALTCAFQALLAPGDEVLVPLPCYPAYGAQIALAGGVPIAVPTGAAAGFKVRPEELLAALTARSRVLILNNPCNPTGSVYTSGELEALLEAAVAADLFIVCDEVYCDLGHEPVPFFSFAALNGEARSRSLVVRSASKTYAMTGWRIGFAAGPEALISAMVTTQEASVVMPASVSQWAAVAALDGPQDSVAARAASFGSRYRYVHDRLSTMTGVRMTEGHAGFFALVDVSEVIEDAAEFCRRLLAHQGVALVPGDAFGVRGTVRLSYATSLPEIADGLDRLEQGLLAERLEPKEPAWTSRLSRP
jgi:aspartate aminotransferase